MFAVDTCCPNPSCPSGRKHFKGQGGLIRHYRYSEVCREYEKLVSKQDKCQWGVRQEQDLDNEGRKIVIGPVIQEEKEAGSASARLYSPDEVGDDLCSKSSKTTNSSMSQEEDQHKVVATGGADLLDDFWTKKMDISSRYIMSVVDDSKCGGEEEEPYDDFEQQETGQKQNTAGINSPNEVKEGLDKKKMGEPCGNFESNKSGQDQGSASMDSPNCMKNQNLTTDNTGAVPKQQNKGQPPTSIQLDMKLGDNSALFAWIKEWIEYAKEQNKQKEAKLKMKYPNGLDYHRGGCPNCPRCSVNADGSAWPRYEELPDETWLLEHFLTDPCFTSGWHVMGKTERAELDLMHRNNRIPGNPLTAYDEFVAWAKRHIREVDENQMPLPPNSVLATMRSREACLNYFEKKSHLKEMAPVTTSFSCAESPGSARVTKIKFLPSLYHQLTNILINGEAQRVPPIEDNKDSAGAQKIFLEINSGSRVKESFKHLAKEEIDKPLPIITFGDASVYDVSSGRNSTDMLSFTIGDFSRKVRYMPDAWQSLGSIPSLTKHEYRNSEGKQRDYQLLLSHLLEDLLQLQMTKKGALMFEADGNTIQMKRMIPFILCNLGDSPGLSKYASKYEAHGCKHPCRSCNIHKDKLDDHLEETSNYTKSDVNKHRKTKKSQKEHSFKATPSAFDNLCYGGCPHGIYGNSPGELGHALQLGFIKLVLDAFFYTKQQSETEQKEDFEEQEKMKEEEEKKIKKRKYGTSIIGVTRADKSKKTEEEMVKQGVFGGQMGQQLNTIGWMLGDETKRQSDNDLPRTIFPKGLTSRARTGAAEQQGIMFLLLVILCSAWARKDIPIEEEEDDELEDVEDEISLQSNYSRSLEKGERTSSKRKRQQKPGESGTLRFSLSSSLGKGRISNYIVLFERLLGLEELMKNTRCDGILEDDIEAISWFVGITVKEASEICQLKVGAGFKRIKTHLLKHMCNEEIRKYGTPDNVSGMPGETMFKSKFKLPASTTRMRSSTFDEDMYRRQYQHAIIKRCYQVLLRIKRMEERFGWNRSHTSSANKGTSSIATANNLSTDVSKEGDVLFSSTQISHDQDTEQKQHPAHSLGPPAHLPNICTQQGGDGLSAPVYKYMKCIDSNGQQHEKTHPKYRMIYTGRDGTNRARLIKSFFAADAKQKGIKKPKLVCPRSGKRVCLEGCGDLLTLASNLGEEMVNGSSSEKKYDLKFEVIKNALGQLTKRKNGIQEIEIYTEFKKGKTIYHADACSPAYLQNDTVGGKLWAGWNDWALFHKRYGEEEVLLPGQIFGFVILTPKQVKMYNQDLHEKKGYLDNLITQQHMPFAIAQGNHCRGFWTPQRFPLPPTMGSGTKKTTDKTCNPTPS